MAEAVKVAINRCWQRRIFLVTILAWIFAFCFVPNSPATDSFLSVRVENFLVDLKAENIPVADILKAITERAGLSIKASEAVTEPYSGDFSGITVEECIRRLLGDRNYVMMYSAKDDGRLVLTEVLILKGSTSTVAGNFPEATVPSSPSPDPLKKYQRAWCLRQLGNNEELSGQITVNPAPDDQPGGGISIEEIAQNSFFEKIGLIQGDVIHDVNGQPITTLQDFIRILKSVASSPDSSLIMIGMRRSDNSCNPIYISLH
jgi:hypothetical protein